MINYTKEKFKAVFRQSKYTIGADAINFLLTHSALLDGANEAPPEIINYAGGGDFKAVGDFIVHRLFELTHLCDGQAVMEIGCGIGRNATALARRLTTIEYAGFDIVAYGIGWCRKFFAGRKNYLFTHADIYNSFYNPRGKVAAGRFRFPYADQKFDVIFATSVFTHMPADQVAHYLMESKRCLTPGGSCYFTCFILDDESRQKIAAGKSQFSFKHKLKDAWTERELEPDVAVAFERDVFLQMISASGLTVSRFVPGNWRGDAALPDFQDAYVLQ